MSEIEVQEQSIGTQNRFEELAKFVFEALSTLTVQHFGKKISAKEVHILEPVLSQAAFDYDFFKKRKSVAIFEETNFGFLGKQTDIFGKTQKTASNGHTPINLLVACPPFETTKDKFEIDERIRETYAQNSQNLNKNALFEMPVRFLRWASDRVQTQGIVTIFGESAWLESAVFEGLRKVLCQEFQVIYCLHTKGNTRTAGERRQKEGENILGIKKGVALYFLVKKQPLNGKKENPPIFCTELPDELTIEQKIQFFQENPFQKIVFEPLFPDEKHFWVRKKENVFKDFLPLIDEKVRTGAQENAIFREFSDKIFDENLHLVFSSFAQRKDFACLVTKKNLENKWLEKPIYIPLLGKNGSNVSAWAVEQFLNFYQNGTYSPNPDLEARSLELKNLCKHFPNISSKAIEIETLTLQKLSPQTAIVQDEVVPNLAKLGVLIDKLRQKVEALLPSAKDKRRLYESVLTHCENFYALLETEYQRADRLLNLAEYITPENIFYYVYAVLHNPAYRHEYAANLRREMPHIPLYADFLTWKEYGEKLVSLHTDFDSVVEYPLHFEYHLDPEKPAKTEKLRLKADKINQEIHLTTAYKLQGIPPEVWEYRLGKGSLLEQYLEEEKAQKEENWAEKQAERISKIRKRCTVSVATVRIVRSME